ncbi:MULTISPECIES: sensor histidine kinase [unclassified Methanoregula]|uniref:sensor histidine kinase n=1 Tax=unclassified Methanoregula TaxID=2649730 RepID=UPI0009C5323F|nr:MULTISPECIES: PAS domain-containing sensor histidine kinase [unclassified Methanoregula]OPX63104.1 MAG: sensory histidine kinase AtoS [Methanoregula sp. PtaB.Bin085]OPY36339.1 MAG: sensory histidine kinase AtoS [Methanoregula sp. PtaU1.Bin006]
MQQMSRRKQVLFDVCTVASVAAAIVITRECLTNGVYDVFPYFYLVPIVLIAFSRPKVGIYGTVFIGWLYFMLAWFWAPADARIFTVATIQFYIFVSLGVLISVYSQEYYRAEQRKCDLYYNSQAGAFSFNEESGKISDTNPKFARMIGYDPEILKTMTLADIIPDPAERASFLSRLHGRQVVVDGELCLLARDGTIRWVLVSSVKTDQDEIICTVVDITDHREARNALSLVNRKLSLLLGVTRHDILNQVTVLRTAAGLARLKTADPAMLQFIGQEETAAQNIQRQIEFVGNYEGIGAHTPVWQNIGARVRALVPAVPDIVIDASPALDAVEVYADPMLDKVFENLIDNSRRHGERVRRISFSLVREPNDELSIVYGDDGIGVPDAEKERIFEKGFGKNTGLGLFLSREILSITDLAMKETGTLGSGARFEIRVPKGKYRFT